MTLDSVTLRCGENCEKGIRKLVVVLSEWLSALCTGCPSTLHTYYSLVEGQKGFKITLQKLNPSQSLISE